MGVRGQWPGQTEARWETPRRADRETVSGQASSVLALGTWQWPRCTSQPPPGALARELRSRGRWHRGSGELQLRPEI